MKDIFRPKLLDTFKDYSLKQFRKDCIAGLVVGIVALPLAIAFAIASGVSPEKGLITAIVGGFLVSALGGSRVQIGGPTGAFIVIVYGVVYQFGVEGLIIATFMAGVMLVLMGLARLGSVIKYIPYSLIIGFTSGIAVIIFSSQIKDFFGLEMGEVPADFVEKWTAFIKHFSSVDLMAVLIGGMTIALVALTPKVSEKVPGSLVAIILSTLVVHIFNIPVETIGSRFGVISGSIPAPQMPGINLKIIQELAQPAFAIAMLGAIESLLSAVVADGMFGGRHRSNTELIGQGAANIGSALFGGIPATGAIARTATNVKNGGRTPIAGIIHALVLLFILVFLGKWASYIPLSCLAGILMVIAFNMSEYRNFRAILKGPRGDVAVMLTTFLLTVFVDLTLAIEIGIILAAFSFIRNMIKSTEVQLVTSSTTSEEMTHDLAQDKLVLPKGVMLIDIAGPLFFGVSYKIKDTMRYMKEKPNYLIVRMKQVTVIDASGISSFQDLLDDLNKDGVRMLISDLESPKVQKEMEKAGLLAQIGSDCIFADYEEALAYIKPSLKEE